jgi:hypothetical protein
MPLKLPPSRLGSGIDKDRPYSVFSGEGGEIGSPQFSEKASASAGLLLFSEGSPRQ